MKLCHLKYLTQHNSVQFFSYVWKRGDNESAYSKAAFLRVLGLSSIYVIITIPEIFIYTLLIDELRYPFHHYIFFLLRDFVIFTDYIFALVKIFIYVFFDRSTKHAIYSILRCCIGKFSQLVFFFHVKRSSSQENLNMEDISVSGADRGV